MAIVTKWMLNSYGLVLSKAIEDIFVLNQYKIIKEVENSDNEYVSNLILKCPSYAFRSVVENTNSRYIIKQYKFNMDSDKSKIFKSNVLHKQLIELGYEEESYTKFNSKLLIDKGRDYWFEFIKDYIGSFITVKYLGVEKTYIVLGINSTRLELRLVQSYTENFLMSFDLVASRGKSVIDEDILDECEVKIYKMKSSNGVLKFLKGLFDVFKEMNRPLHHCKLAIRDMGNDSISNLYVDCVGGEGVLKYFDDEGIDKFKIQLQLRDRRDSVLKVGSRYILTKLNSNEIIGERTFKQISNLNATYSITLGILSSINISLTSYLDAKSLIKEYDKRVEEFNNKLWYANTLTHQNSISKSIFKGLEKNDYVDLGYYTTKRYDVTDCNIVKMISGISIFKDYSTFSSINIYLNSELFNFKDTAVDCFIECGELKRNIGYVDINNGSCVFLHNSSDKYKRQYVLDKEFIDNSGILEEGSYTEGVISFISLYNYTHKEEDNVKGLNVSRYEFLDNMMRKGNEGNKIVVYKR